MRKSENPYKSLESDLGFKGANNFNEHSIEFSSTIQLKKLYLHSKITYFVNVIYALFGVLVLLMVVNMFLEGEFNNVKLNITGWFILLLPIWIFINTVMMFHRPALSWLSGFILSLVCVLIGVIVLINPTGNNLIAIIIIAIAILGVWGHLGAIQLFGKSKVSHSKLKEEIHKRRGSLGKDLD